MRNIVYLLLVLGIFGCSESSLIPDDNQLGLSYFPLEKGQFRIYEVNEINFSVLGSDTSFYQLKESVVDSFFNVENLITYIVHRSTRANEAEPWKLDSVWTARRSSDFAVMVENNRSIIKLVFPIEHGVQWDGNELNGRNENFFTYDLNISDTLLTNNEFTELVKVIQSDIPENLINRDERYEIYGKEVGLIIKNSIILEFCQQDCLEEKTIESGRIFKATLLEYGKE